LEYKDKIHKVHFVIAKNDVISILGEKSLDKLGLIKRVFVIDEAECIEQDQLNSNEAGAESSQKIAEKYQDVFQGLGCLKAKCKIEVDESVTPVVTPCRKIPFKLHQKLKNELDRMEREGVICTVNEPTNWVNGIVTPVKKNGDLRVCLDPRPLNKAIKREHYKLPTREEVMAQFANAQYFSKLDASQGFWQLKLDEESSKLTCFNTPFGRKRFLRLPFGIKSAPEIYHKAIHELFEDIPGVDTSMDDIIIYAASLDEHDARLIKVLDTVREANLKLNKAKCVFGVQRLTFLGDVLTSEGLRPDPIKVQAIRDFKRPQTKKEIQRFLAMVNYQGRFLQNLSAKTAPLRTLLEEKNEFQWSNEQERCFEELKEILSKEPVLKFYDSKRPIKISSDSSKSGLGAVLLQSHNHEWFPVAYASRALTQAEQRYAQIEKECLSIVFACERFYQYIYGQPFECETDHKPLVSIVNQKNLNDCPLRIQRLLLRLQKFDIRLSYTPGKYMYTSDALSRAYSESPVKTADTGEADVEVYVNMVFSNLNVSDEKLEKIRSETREDEQFKILTNCILSGFPHEKRECPVEIRDFWNIRNELSLVNGIILKGLKVVIPRSLRKEMLQKIHVGHLGIEKCRRRAREVLYWPGLNQEVADMVKNCPACNEYKRTINATYSC
jgi:hypothetical protein